MQPALVILRLIVALAAGALAASAFAASAAAQLKPGDILVIDPDVPPVSTAVLFRVDPQTGARTVLFNFGGSSPSGVAVEADGSILVTDTAAGTDPSGGTSEWGVLYRLRPDPVTGALTRTILSDFGVGASTGRDPRAVTVEADGQILVLNGRGGTTGVPFAERPLLVRIDPATGARTVVSDFGNRAQGDPSDPPTCTTSCLGVDARGLAVEADGQILVIDAQAGQGDTANGQGLLFRVDPQTGSRIRLSNFGVGDNQGANPSAVAVEASGQILVTDEGPPSTSPLGLLFRVDRQSGLRSVQSNFNTGANTGREPAGVALEADGQILVVDKHAGAFNRGMLFRVDSQTGARAIVSDFGAGANQGGDPLALAVVPPLSATLVVITEVINDEFGTLVPGDFTMTVTGGNPAPASFPGEGPPGRSVTLDPGSYGTGVVPRPGYRVMALSPECGGTIAVGETKTCTVTLDDDDSDAPTITCADPGLDWLGDNVFVACAASDAGSGLANPDVDRMFSLFTSVPDGVEDGNASTGTRRVCDVAGNCAVAGPITGVKIDRKAPTLSLPADLIVEATSPAGATVSFIVSATDGGALPNPPVTCTPAAGSVFAIGTTTVACTATDGNGHTSNGSFTITVLGAPEQLAALVDEVLAASSLPAAVKAELLARIQPLLGAFDPSNPAHRRAVCTGLRVFANALSLFSGRGVPPAQAAEWIADANRIRAVIGC